MDLLNRAQLGELIAERDVPCISLYLPTHRAGKEIKQDPIRFKNILKQAEERLLNNGLRRSEASEILAPAQPLLADDAFWQHQSDGLAVFISTRMFRCLRLPFGFAELVVVTDRFHVKPLLTLLSVDGRFYVLALSQNQVRLLQGSRHSVGTMNLASVPSSLAEALGDEEREKQLQLHTAGRSSAPIFHGHGGGGTDESLHKKDLLRYFKIVDRGLQDLIGAEQAPVVLAGVDYLLPIYREANTCAQLVDEVIVGNPEHLSDRELHSRAWSILEPLFASKLKRAADQYRELVGAGRASRDLEQILPAASGGRVESLFVAVGVQVWGAYDQRAGEVEVHGERESGDQDLLDLAAVETLVHQGNVYAVSPDQMPDADADGSIAAVFRY
jgi:hypothetical protein